MKWPFSPLARRVARTKRPPFHQQSRDLPAADLQLARKPVRRPHGRFDGGGGGGSGRISNHHGKAGLKSSIIGLCVMSSKGGGGHDREPFREVPQTCAARPLHLTR